MSESKGVGGGAGVGAVLQGLKPLPAVHIANLTMWPLRLTPNGNKVLGGLSRGFCGLEVTFAGSSGQNSVTRPQPDHRGWGNFIFLWAPAKTHAVMNT